MVLKAIHDQKSYFDFRTYVELLARVILDGTYLESLENSASGRSMAVNKRRTQSQSSNSSNVEKMEMGAALAKKLLFDQAVNSIESRIATRRESLVGSGAWGRYDV